MILIVSPHFDDAVFSVGDYMAAADDDVVVVTVFGGSPRHRGFLSDWDRECGFTTSHEAMQERRAENRRALAVLDAEPIDLWFGEYAYGPPWDSADAPDELDWYRDRLAVSISDALGSIVERLKPDVMLVPVGITHPDHRLVSYACTSRQLDGVRKGEYADLPYALHAEHLLAHRGDPVTPTPTFALKAQAVEHYASQLTLVERMGPVLSQERIWWRP